MGFIGVNGEINKASVVAAVAKTMNIDFPQDNAYQFLVDVINNATTIKKLDWVIKGVPSGHLDTLKVGKRKLRSATGNSDSNENPTGVGSISQGQIPYSVKKVFWDEWIKNDDVVYNAIRQAQQLAQQQGITSTADLEKLIIQMIQKQFAMDMQELLFLGDTDYPAGKPDTDFFNILDGFVKQLRKSPYKTDLGAVEPELIDFIKCAKMVPEEYRNNFESDYVWVMNRSTHDTYAAKVAMRPTEYGDTILKDGMITRIAGYPVEIVAGLTGALKDPTDPTKGRRGVVIFTPFKNLCPVLTQNLKYVRTGDGPLAAKKDATYHILHAYMDAVVRDVNAASIMEGDKL